MLKKYITLFALIFNALLFADCSRNYNYRTLEERIVAAQYYYEQGIYALQRQDAGFALPNFTEAIRILPDLADAYYQRARIYLAAEMKNEGISDFENAKKYSLKYIDMKAVEPLEFKLNDADLQLIKTEPIPKEAAVKETSPKPLEPLRNPDYFDETNEE